MIKKLLLLGMMLGALMSTAYAERGVYFSLGNANFDSDFKDESLTSYVFGFESINYSGNNFLTGGGIEFEKEKNIVGVSVLGKLAYSIHEDMYVYLPAGLKYLQGKGDFNAVGIGWGLGFSYHIPESPVSIGIDFKNFSMINLKEFDDGSSKELSYNRIGIQFTFLY